MTQIKHPEENIQNARRAFLGAVSGIAGASLLATASPAAQAAGVNTKARIVIAESSKSVAISCTPRQTHKSGWWQ